LPALSQADGAAQLRLGLSDLPGALMPVLCEKFLQQLRSGGAGVTTFTLTDPAFDPIKAVIFTNLMFASSTNPDPLFQHRVDKGNLVNFAIGFDDLSDHAGGIAVANGPFFGDFNPIQCSSSTHGVMGCVQTNALINSLRLKGKVTAKGAGHFDLLTDIQDVNSSIWVEGFAFGGSDITAEVITWVPPGTGARTATFSIVPRIVFAIASPHVEHTDLRSVGYNIGLGWAVHCDGKGGCSAVGRGGGGSYGCYQRAQRLCAFVNAITNVPFGEIEVTGGWGTNTLNINVMSLGVGYYTFLALGGNISGNIGTFLQGDPTFSYKMQRPVALLTTTVGKPPATTVQRDANFNLGLQANLVTAGNPPSNYHNLINRLHLGGLLAILPDGHNEPWGGKVQTVLGSGGVSISGVAPIECQEATGVGALSLKAKAIPVLSPEVGALTWTVDDGGGREFNYLLVGDDSSGIDPCGGSEDDSEELVVLCPADSGTVGFPYNSAVSATGGTAPYTWAVISGALPTGLTLDPDSGAITGTPTETGTFEPEFEVTDDDDNTGTSVCPITIEEPSEGDCPVPRPGSSVAGGRLIEP